MNLENKKQVAIIAVAIGMGLLAAVMMGNYVQTSAQNERRKIFDEVESKKVKPLMQEISAMQKEMKQLAAMQATIAKNAGGQGGLGPGGEAPTTPKSSLALRTPAGKRAYTVMIDSLSAVGGLVNPGDYVDALAHLDIPDPITKVTEKISSIVFQNIQILAVGTNLQAPGGYEEQQRARALNITFALTPEEASLMSFIEKNGKMQLILRAPAETEVEVLQPATWSTLADYVFEKQGTELVIPRERAVIQPVSTKKEEVQPFIPIYKGGRLQ